MSRYVLLVSQCIQRWKSCVWEWQQIYRGVAGKVCMACNAGFCWWCVSFL